MIQKSFAVDLTPLTNISPVVLATELSESITLTQEDVHLHFAALLINTDKAMTCQSHLSDGGQLPHIQKPQMFLSVPNAMGT